ncbi:pyridoxamine 5'-phosphate oxidase family protein [Paenibacillus sp. JX-17]|uniref:Pyridoxamine 5'-phosphate oxidase family protein n=1 Tax=Paenibacillus lacisoli TaxID=3064525 RepID=A0ABT9CC32_9BACL|nr:pyridoxamine 5'-phosphate oxidase family protein [Paenibacillus sp. JX-17]MDO7906828.1 pyridoxamine 5'-phosphate oxidase family protein [Paenibacillus sp. JX-17]
MEVQLPEALLHLLNGQHLEDKQHDAMMLQTVTEDGWPHNAMLSVGEVVALDNGRLRLALWPGTTTTGNLIRSGRALLVLVHEGTAYYIRLELQLLPELEQAMYPRARFEAAVAAVREDVAKYAELRSGVTFALKEPEAVLPRWRDTLEELLR